MLAVHQAAADLLQCVCDSLAQIPTDVPGLAGCPCRACVVPGLVAADGCGEGCELLPAGEFPGQLTTSVVRIFTTDRQSFPREQALSGTPTVRSGKDCPPPPVTAVDLLVTLYRCAPIPTDEGCPPSCAELEEAAMQLHVDMLAIQRGVLCCYAGTDTTRRHGRRYVLGSSRALGPQGGCVGVEQTLTVSLDDCIACPVPTP